MLTYLFHGPSGSGKDTQLDLLSKKYDFERIGTGEMFRQLYSANNPDAVEAYKYWSVGNWVPSELTYKLLRVWLEQYDKKKNWILVSVVRQFDQIAMLDSLLAEFDRKLDKFVHLKLNSEAAVDRLSGRKYCSKCGATYHVRYKIEKIEGKCDVDGNTLICRDDDKPDAILKRLDNYNKTITPIADEYRERGILLEIDASGTIEQIFADLEKKINL